ncbi:MAG: N-acetyltransferase, partial [Thermoprotei archaeon]
GPIGVDSAVRGRGIGTVLLYKSLESLRVRGYRYIVIPWTGHLFFYTQLPGVKSIRHYWILEKKLK